MKNRDIQQIRKNIALRKKAKKNKNVSDPPSANSTYSLNEEEKHGFYPFVSDQSSSNSHNVWMMSILFKTLLAAILFFSVAIIFQVESERLDQPKQYLKTALTREFPFATVQTWYRDHFGAPFSMVNKKNSDENGSDDENSLPVHGMISESFSNSGEGLTITSEEEASVTAMNEGTVIFAGKKKDLGNTVIIQHTDGTNTIYGNLDHIDVYLYEFIDKQESIGTISPGEGKEASLFFAIQQGDEYINPVKVMKVDEGS